MANRVDPPAFGSPGSQRDPYVFYDWARNECPVHKVPDRDDYLLTRHDDVVAAARNTELFSSRGTPRDLTLPGQRYAHEPALSDNDPPEHTAIRKAVYGMFTPARTRAYRSVVQHEVDGLLAEMPCSGEIEFVGAFAEPLPTRVIGSLLGFDRDVLQQLKLWSDDNSLLLAGYHTAAERERLERSYVDFINFCGDEVAARQDAPRDDLMSELAAARDDAGRPFPIEKLASVVRLLVLGGNETTTFMLTNAIVDILASPGLSSQMGDEKRALRVLEESLRKESPAAWTQRRATSTLLLRGVEIPAGARILLGWGAANRDDRVFSSPAIFDVDRSRSNRSVAFGYGPHFCLGAPLARLEGVLALSTFFGRFEVRFSAGNDLEPVVHPPNFRSFRQVFLEVQRR